MPGCFSKRLLLPLSVALLAAGLSACAGSDDHVHGPDTHTHDGPAVQTMSADTAGTYVDTTGAFFGDHRGPDEAADEDAESGPGADHVHESGEADHHHDE